MLELHPYLKRVYEDEIVDCMMCREIAIRVGTCMLILFNNFSILQIFDGGCVFAIIFHFPH